jgi:hypothetical protein
VFDNARLLLVLALNVTSELAQLFQLLCIKLVLRARKHTNTHKGHVNDRDERQLNF